MSHRTSANRQVAPRFKGYSQKRFAADIQTAEIRAFACEVILRMILENSDVIDTREVQRAAHARTQRETFLLFSVPEGMLDGLAALFASDAELEGDDPQEVDDEPEEGHDREPDCDDEPDQTGSDGDGAPVSGVMLSGDGPGASRAQALACYALAG